jgi:predicted nucleic acid-binding protein
VILYLDTSALATRYLAEPGAHEVQGWISQARLVGTSLITRAEMGAAITKAVRMNWISPEEGQAMLQRFRSEWEMFVRLPVYEITVQRADDLACRYGLRGFDSVHLACAILYREGLGEPVTLATYDRPLWQAAQAEGLLVLPADLP